MCLQCPALGLPIREVIFWKVQYGEERTSLYPSSSGSRNGFDDSRGRNSRSNMAIDPRGTSAECRKQLMSRCVQLSCETLIAHFKSTNFLTTTSTPAMSTSDSNAAVLV